MLRQSAGLHYSACIIMQAGKAPVAGPKTKPKPRDKSGPAPAGADAFAAAVGGLVRSRAPSAASRAGSSPSSRARPSAISPRSKAGRAIRRSSSSRRSPTRSTFRSSSCCRAPAGAAKRSTASSICSRSVPPSELPAIADLIEGRTNADLAADRARRIALVGLRGAGKSTLGRMLAERLGCPSSSSTGWSSRTTARAFPT